MGAYLAEIDEGGHRVVNAGQLGILQLPHNALCILLSLQCIACVRLSVAYYS